MEWTPLNPQHRKLLNYYLASYNELSHIGYSNFLLWNTSRQYQLSHISEHCFIRYIAGDDWLYLFPLTFGDKAQALSVLLQHQQNVVKVEGLSNEQVAWLYRSEAIDAYALQNDRDQADYVYSIADLINLPGQAYRRQRNFCKQFSLLGSCRYVSIDADNKHMAEQFLRRWFLSKQQLHSDEWLGIQNVLAQFDETDVVGGMLLVDGCVAALSLSEQLNPDTVVIHVEKADTTYRGAYQAINRAHLEHHWSHMSYVNRQQDLGITGLRQAKLSYRPVAMVEKSRCQVRHTVRQPSNLGQLV